jgi:diguanylate cyclase (GGDEF)-like protein
MRSSSLLRQAVTTDPLTRLHNRSAILDVAASRFSEARAADEPFSLVVLELDRFHEINDQYGHHAGDEVLQLAALSAKRVLRGEDVIGRIGSAEFMIVLPGARDREARQVAERLRQKVQNQPLLLDELPLQVTISLGVAEVSQSDERLDGLVSRAEAALEEAKQDGANIVKVAAAPSTPASQGQTSRPGS